MSALIRRRHVEVKVHKWEFLQTMTASVIAPLWISMRRRTAGTRQRTRSISCGLRRIRSKRCMNITELGAFAVRMKAVVLLPTDTFQTVKITLHLPPVIKHFVRRRQVYYEHIKYMRRIQRDGFNEIDSMRRIQWALLNRECAHWKSTKLNVVVQYLLTHWHFCFNIKFKMINTLSLTLTQKSKDAPKTFNFTPHVFTD